MVMLPPDDDTALVLRAQSGDQAALAQLWERHAPGVLRVLRGRLGVGTPQRWLTAECEELAADLASETWVRVLRHLGQWRPQGAPFHAWLYRVACNLHLDQHRRQRVVRFTPLVLDREDEAQHAALEAVEDAASIAPALDALTPLQAAVVRLRWLEDQSVEATAATLGRPSIAIRQTQQRAFRTLRARLAAQGIASAQEMAA